MKSTKTKELAIPELSSAATKAHIFPDIKKKCCPFLNYATRDACKSFVKAESLSRKIQKQYSKEIEMLQQIYGAY